MRKQHYSDAVPQVLHEAERIRIGHQILRVLQIHLGKKLAKMTVLDLGCSNGIITRVLASHVKSIVGVDVDQKALASAQKKYTDIANLSFRVENAEKTSFPSQSFDLIICSQLYYSIFDLDILLQEIHRLLKKKGTCYFSGRNKYALMEQQYRLLFLSWLPYPLGNRYVKMMRNKNYVHHYYLSYTDLTAALARYFKLTDLTLTILKNPQKYQFTKLIQWRAIVAFIPVSLFKRLIPNYIFLLRKR